MSSKFQIFSILLGLLFVQPMLSPDSNAHARRRAAIRAYSFITTGEKVSQAQCDGETKVPRRLKQQKEMRKAGSYMGSELIDDELKTQDSAELWKHFFRNKASCNSVLAKAPSSLEESKRKDQPELPPEEADEPDREEEEVNPPAAE